MSVGGSDFLLPIEEYERRLVRQQDVARRQAGCLAAWWIAVQVVAATELVTSLVVLWRIDLDTLVTVGLLWVISVPCAGGAAVVALSNWPMLSRRGRAVGLAPWGAIVAELTVAIVWLVL